MHTLKRTLAELFLESEPFIGGTDPINALKIDKGLRDVLAPPAKNFLLAQPAPYAERFVFEFDPALALGDLIKSGAVTQEQCKLLFRLPTEIVWMESSIHDEKGRQAQFGILVDQSFLPRYTYLVLVIGDYHQSMPILGLSIPRWELITGPKGMQLWNKIEWSSKTHRNPRPVLDELVFPFLVGALFHLNIPKMIELRPSTGKTHAPPTMKPATPGVIEYKKVTLRPGLIKTRYEQERREGESEAAYHKRLHRVIGHFRTYTHYRDHVFEQPKVAWIEPHWRGDADLGIVLHETHVEPLPPKDEP